MGGIAPAQDAIEYLLWRHALADGEVTTIYAVRYPSDPPALVSCYFPRTEHLGVWCQGNGFEEAVVGGFFLRDRYRPLGELWIDGRPLRHEPVAPPFAPRRGSVWIDDGDVRLVERAAAPARPPGDLNRPYSSQDQPAPASRKVVSALAFDARCD